MSLYKSIKIDIENKRKESPYLMSLAEKVEEIILKLKERQISPESALDEYIKIAEDIAKAEDEQKESKLSKEEFSYFWVLKRYGVKDPENISKNVNKIIAEKEHWVFNENLERQLRMELYKLFVESQNSEIDLVKLVDELLRIDKIMRGGEDE